MEIYLDLVVLLNFLVDYLLLLGTNRLAGFPPGRARCGLAAALGALYSGCCLLPGFAFLGNLLWRSVFLCLMAAVAFGGGSSMGKRSALFLLLKYSKWGLFLFVAIPLPGTGAWSGALIASLLDMRVKNAFPTILLGVLCAAVIMTVGSTAVDWILGLF